MRLIADCIVVGAAGFFGCVARYIVAIGLRRFSIGFPLGTMTVNILGCLIIGLLAQAISSGQNVSPQTRLALAVGFCGGFTTMSSFIYEMAEFLRLGQHFYALLYFAGTIMGSFFAFYAGFFIFKAKLGV